MSFSNVKSVIIDIADSWLVDRYVGIRRLEFFDESDTLHSISSSDYSAYATSSESGWSADNAFDTTLSKTGTYNGTEWMSAEWETSSQRLICVFNSVKTIAKIVSNNSHDSGSETSQGAKNVKIYFSTDTITDTTYNASIANSSLVYDGQIAQHIASDEADDQTLTLIEPPSDVDIDTQTISFDFGINITNINQDIGTHDITLGFGVNAGDIRHGVIVDNQTISTSFGLTDKAIAQRVDSQISISFSLSEPSINLNISNVVIGIGFGLASGEISFFKITDALIRYYCTIKATGYDDIDLPMSSFQARRRADEPTYLNVIIPTMDFITDIADRANGQIVIYQGYVKDDEILQKETIIVTDIERVDFYRGGRNQSISLTGYTTTTYEPKAVTLNNAIYHSVSNGKVTYRLAEPYIYLNPSDIVTIGDDTFTVDLMSYAISTNNQTIEISGVA